MERSGIPVRFIPMLGAEQLLGYIEQDRNLFLNNLPNDLIDNDIITMGYHIAKVNRPVCLRDAVVDHGIGRTQTYEGFTNDNTWHVNCGFHQVIRGKLLKR